MNDRGKGFTEHGPELLAGLIEETGLVGPLLQNDGAGKRAFFHTPHEASDSSIICFRGACEYRQMAVEIPIIFMYMNEQ